MTTPQKVLEEVGADNPTNCVISNSNNECCPTQQNFPKLPELPSFDERPTTEGTTFESSTSDPYSTADVTRNFTTRVTTHDHDGSTLSTGPTSPTSPISDPPDVPIRTTDIADQLTSTSYYPDNSTTNRDPEGSTAFANDPVTTRSGSDIRTVGSSSYTQTSFQTAKSDVPSSFGGITSSSSVTATAEDKGSTVANSDPFISTHYESFSHPTDITIISDTKVPSSPELGVPSDGRWSTLKDVDSTLMSTGSIRTELSSEKYHTEPFSDATEIVSPLTEDNYYSADLTQSPVTSSKTLTPFSGNGGDHTLIIVLSCVGFICLAVVVCVISYYVYLYWKRKKQRRPNPELPMNNTADLTVTPVNGHSPSPAAERRSGTFHNPDGNFVELHPATKPAWEGNDNDGYQSDSEVNGNGGNVDSGVVISPKPEMNGTEETKEDNKPKKKKKKKKKKKAPDLNESLIERPPAEKKTKPTEVIT